MLSRTQNVVVSARPGAGKTATAEAISVANSDQRIVILTFSKQLQVETARRLRPHKNCDVYTFHGMAGKLFSAVVYDDKELRRFRREGKIPMWTDRPYDIVILDELQDCSELLFWFICALISTMTHAAGGRAPRIVALGDERQAIHSFRGGDARFLSLSPYILGEISPYPWTEQPLSTSFRLSHEIARFVNGVFLGGDPYLAGSHNGPMPMYVHVNSFEAHVIARTLVPLIRRYGPERTAILTPSVVHNHVVSRFTNLLSRKYKFGVADPTCTSQEGALDDLVLKGKISVSTYHQFKGKERDLVIVYGVDASYFKYYGRDLPVDICPNEIFVTLTRAKKQLVVLHDQSQGPLPFLSLPQLYETGSYINLAASDMKAPPPSTVRPLQGFFPPERVSVSDIARYVPDQTLETIVETHLQITQINISSSPPPEHIVAPDKVLTDSTPGSVRYEAVSDLNGLAVPAAFEYTHSGTLFTLGYTADNTPHCDVASDKQQFAAWLCREACAYAGKQSGYESRIIQMKHHPFDWFGQGLDIARKRIEEQLAGAGLGLRLHFEVELMEEGFTMIGGGVERPETIDIFGRADIIQDGRGLTSGETATASMGKATLSSSKENQEEVTIWEIKFVSRLTLEYAVQAAIYGYLWSVKHKQPTLPRIVLFNTRDGDKWEIDAHEGVVGMRKLIEELLRVKYTSRASETTDHEAFLKKGFEIREEVKRSGTTDRIS